MLFLSRSERCRDVAKAISKVYLGRISRLVVSVYSVHEKYSCLGDRIQSILEVSFTLEHST